jgi:hypothetical protein
MQAYCYIYRGPKQSLLGMYVVGMLVIKEGTRRPKDLRVPSVKHLYDRYLYLEEEIQDPRTYYQAEIREGIYRYVCSINADEINRHGELAVKKTVDKMRSWALSISILQGHEELFFKRVKYPKTWYERYLVAITSSMRRNLLTGIYSCCFLNESLELNLSQQLSIVGDYKLLPPYFDWTKTIKAFSNLEPKPFWWSKEIDSYYTRYFKY